MNRLLIAALAVIAFAPALAIAAQTVDPVFPRGLSDTPMDPPTELQDAPPPAPPPRPMKNEIAAQRDADARQCLTLPTNRQVAACAERYRQHAARVRAAKSAKAGSTEPMKTDAAKAGATATATTTTTTATATAKPADTGKGTTSAAATTSTTKPPAEPPKTSNVINLPPLKPITPAPAPAEPAKGSAAPKAPETAKK
jgi:hypothetical protein